MNISWIIFLAVASFFLVVAFGVPIESQELAERLTSNLVSGYLGYLTHVVKERMKDDRK